MEPKPSESRILKSPFTVEGLKALQMTTGPEKWAKLPLWRRMLTAWSVLIISLLGTFLAWKYAEMSALSEAEARFKIDIQKITSDIQNRLTNYEALLQGTKGLFASTEAVTRDEWEDYVQTLNISKNYPGMKAIGYIEKVRSSNKAIHEANVRKKGFPSYKIWPASEHQDSYPIVYINTVDSKSLGNDGSLGFDGFTDPERRKAMEKACDSESPAITGKLISYQNKRSPSFSQTGGFLIYVPIYAKNKPLATVEQRRAAVIGFVFGAFRMYPFMRTVSGEFPLDINFRIFDEEGNMDPYLFDRFPSSFSQSKYKPLFKGQTKMEIGGRVWTIDYSTLPNFKTRTKARYVLFSGLLGSLALFAMVWSLTTHTHSLAQAAEVTAQLRLMERAISAATNGLVITDPRQHDNPIVYVNPAFERLTGYHQAEVLGRNCRFLQGTDRDQLDLHRLRASLREERECRVVLRNYRKDGSLFWNELTISPVRDKDQKLTNYVGIIVDITERRKTEESMLHVQKLESLGVLAGGIAHDFNNLLAVVLGNADLALQDLPKDSSARSFLEQIELASLRGADLCKQMLAYSGKGRFVIQQADLNELVKEMAHLLEVSISKKASLKYHFASKLPLVEVDATQIRQVIMNLVVNASDALGENEGNIILSTGTMHAGRAYLTESYLAPDLQEGTYVYLEVQDTGCGMDEQTKAKIFDPFFTTKFTGRGLGLAAVLGIARGHKGAIKIQSAPGLGSTFRFLLPASSVPEPNHQTKFDSVDLWRGSGTVLVADDEENFRKVTTRMLENLGFKVISAADGREAIHVFRDHTKVVSLVLLDLTMPHMNGEEVFQELQRIQPGARVILMSGYTEEETSERFASQGLAGFLQKPFKLNDLREKLQVALEKEVT